MSPPEAGDAQVAPPRSRIRRIALVAATVAAVILSSAGGVVALVERDTPIAPGDLVTYHVYAYRESDDVLIFTTDLDRARAEVEAGNPVLPKDLDPKAFRPAGRLVELTPEPFEVVRFLVDHRPGDLIRTPYVVNPLGTSADWPTYTIPRKIGPLATEFDINLQATYKEGSQAWFKDQVDRTEFVVGNTLPYVGGLVVTVLEASDERARLRLELPTDQEQVVESESIGIPFRIERASEGAIWLYPIVELDQKFETKGCRLPENFLPAGRFTVDQIGTDNVTVKKRPNPLAEPLFNVTARFEYSVVSVEKWPQPQLNAGSSQVIALLRSTIVR